MRDAAGFDDYCEYCSCGVFNCDGSCSEEDDRDQRDDDLEANAAWDQERSEVWDRLQEVENEFDELVTEEGAILQSRRSAEQAYVEAMLGYCWDELISLEEELRGIELWSQALTMQRHKVQCQLGLLALQYAAM